MIRHRLVIWTLSALLAACNPTPPIEGAVPIPPPASVCAEIEAEPVSPELTSDQRLSLDVATVRVLGQDLAVPLIRFRDVSHPAWGRRQAERIRAARSALCHTTSPNP